MDSKSNQGSASRVSRRGLFVNILDDVANADPSQPFVYSPRSSNPEDGWQPMTYGEAANAVNYIAHQLVREQGHPATDTFPTIAYIGPNDVRYILFLLGAFKAGYVALMISPRNTDDVQLHLFNETKCNLIWHPKSHAKVVEPWLQRRDMKATVMPGVDSLVHTPMPQFPYSKTVAKAEWDPLVILHTSGSTGVPKPVVSRVGLWTMLPSIQDLPKFQGVAVAYDILIEPVERSFVVFPLFHAGGLWCVMSHTLFRGKPVVLPIATQPMTPELLRKSIECSCADVVSSPPSPIDQLAKSEEGVRTLAKLKWVMNGGGSLPTETGDKLADKGVTLWNAVGSTEMGIYPTYVQQNPKLWQYFIMDPEALGCELRPYGDTADSLYELVAVRSGSREHPTPAVFYTFPELEEWSTKDLYKPHPTLPHHWIYSHRVDDVIVFSNGEKLNPVTIEEMVSSHPELKGALVVGQGRFQAALILEPVAPLDHPSQERDLIDEVWEVIQKANSVTVAHGRIAKDLVMVTRPGRPFFRAGKGSIQRPVSTKLYEWEINELYDRASNLGVGKAPALDMGSEEALVRSIQAIFTDIAETSLDPDTDFFTAGIDSLQVVTVLRALRAGLRATNVETNISTATIYSNSTLRKLAQHLRSGNCTESDEQDVEAAQRLLAEYTRDLAQPVSDKLEPTFECQTVVITGTTGSLGSYLLDALIRSSNVRRIFALNRQNDGGREKQELVNAGRGLSTNWDKVRFLRADLSSHHLGLSPTEYAMLLIETDHIIHNAWPVNFHYSTEWFAPHIKGVRQLLDLAAAARKHASMVFISSRGSVDRWSSPDPVPESQLSDLTLASPGYGRAKSVSSLVLDAGAAASDVSSATIRLGQIAGPKSQHGQWNVTEYLPSLIKSSIHLGVLPDSLGAMSTLDWVPVEDMASVILDVAGVTVDSPLKEVQGYFHGVNPQTTTWQSLVHAIMEVYGDRIMETVPLDRWIALLETSANNADDVDKNPAVKLLDTYRAFQARDTPSQGFVALSTDRTVAKSPTARELQAVTPELMRLWCRQWAF